MMQKKKIRSLYCFLQFLIFVVVFSSCRRPEEFLTHVIPFDEGWRIQSSAEVSEQGKILSQPGLDASGWYPTSVPSTVLAALIENGVYKNPFFGKNLESIPTAPFKDSWWYRKEFEGDIIKPNMYARLVFEGINYSANVWLNGRKIASADDLLGAFRIFELDITDIVVPATNALAIEVLPPKPGDFTIGFVDWNPRPPDGNMGIWRGVKLRLNGPVSLDRPFVRPEVDVVTLEKASLTVSADLSNNTGKMVSGVVSGEIEDIRFEQSFELEPHEKKVIFFRPGEYAALTMKQPRLWWPNNLGEPELYSLKMSATVDGVISDVQDIRFGIRDVSDYINEGGHRGYMINGKKILIRGAGWVDDLFLVEDRKKVEAQVAYAKLMNLNALRLEGFWGSSQMLYDLADQYGILLMAGWSCQWEWEDYLGKPVDEFGGVKTPEEMELIARSMRDQVVWIRNHPSIFVWVLGSDMLPRPELEKMYYSTLEEVDPSRPRLSACGWSESEVTGPTAVKMNGPYDYVTPNYWFVDQERGGAFGFNTETGPGPQPPPLESIKKMIPEDHLWPVDDYWDFHCGRNEFNTLNRYIHALNRRYGEPENVEEFARVAQAVNYEAMRAMFEAFGVNKHNTTGIIQWMYNSAWPEMYWQLFDYYLMPNGAFFGAKRGSEPLHIAYHMGDKNIYIVNDTLNSFSELTAEVIVLDTDSKVLLSENLPVSIEENSAGKIFTIPQVEGLSSVYFVVLRLKNDSGEILGRNFYWLSTKEDVLDEEASLWFVTPNRSFADLKGLKDLPEARIEKTYRVKDLGNEQEIQVTLENVSDRIAFFCELNVAGSETGNSILPVFWEDNYVSLLPGETRVISARFSKEDLKGETPVLRISGWNVQGD